MACHHAADARGKSEHVGDSRRVQQLVLKQEKHTGSHIKLITSSPAWNVSISWSCSVLTVRSAKSWSQDSCEGSGSSACVWWMCVCAHYLTGIFFCVTTTTLSVPLIPTDVSPLWEMALKAYSARKRWRKVDLDLTNQKTLIRCECIGYNTHLLYEPRNTRDTKNLSIYPTITRWVPLQVLMETIWTRTKPNWIQIESVLSVTNVHTGGTASALQHLSYRLGRGGPPVKIWWYGGQSRHLNHGTCCGKQFFKKYSCRYQFILWRVFKNVVVSN